MTAMRNVPVVSGAMSVPVAAVALRLTGQLHKHKSQTMSTDYSITGYTVTHK